LSEINKVFFAAGRIDALIEQNKSITLIFEFLIIEDNRAFANMGKLMIEEKNACKGVIASSRKQVNELLCRVNQNLDILDQIELIRDAANRDYLTKLYNRRYFFKEGIARYEKAVKKGRPISAAMMDIDFFKKVNDTQGHDGGDEALRHIARFLTEMFPDVLVSRFGGEEFCILMPFEKDQAHKRLDKFRKKIAASPVETDKYNFSYTVSIGFTDIPGEDIDNMLARADMGLYEAKKNGRNQVVYSKYENDENIQVSSVRQKRRSGKTAATA